MEKSNLTKLEQTCKEEWENPQVKVRHNLEKQNSPFWNKAVM